MQANFLLSSFLLMCLCVGGAGVVEEARSEWIYQGSNCFGFPIKIV